MPIYFIAVTNGQRADGWLIANNQIFVARSGRLLADTDPAKIRNGRSTERGEVPAGVYQIGQRMALTDANRLTMSDGQGDVSRFRKFEILPTASNRQRTSSGEWGVRDARYPDAPRTVLRFHFDGDRPGSEGCIVYDDFRAQAALDASRTNKDTEVRVEYLRTEAEVRARVRAITGRDPASGAG